MTEQHAQNYWAGWGGTGSLCYDHKRREVSGIKKGCGSFRKSPCPHGQTKIYRRVQRLQYRNIEDINRQQLAEYMRKFALNYSEEAILTVLRHRKYKKSTIAFLAAFLGFWNTKHTLQQYLSRLSAYAIPQMEEFYAST